MFSAGKMKFQCCQNEFVLMIMVIVILKNAGWNGSVPYWTVNLEDDDETNIVNHIEH